jgi:Zn-dependent peptidase ImmA (M78 family)/DNA-binding XRE family transcriptional regulator
MATAAKKRHEMPINSDVLVWARERVHLDHDVAAAGAGVTPERLQDWERGEKIPTVKQARKLAEVYDRPFLEFFSRERPKVKEPETIPDFRMQKGVEVPKGDYELFLIKSEAEEIRLNALDLFEILGEEPPLLPKEFFGTIEDNVEMTAARTRRILDLSVEEQTDLKSKEKDRFVTILRNKFESAGILVTKNSGLIQFGSRGMCFFAMPLPIIVFSNEAPSGQAFTLAHELGHVVLKQSALSGVPGSSAPSAKRIEDWCNAFAGAFLVPSSALARLFAKPISPLAKISEYELDKLAKAFAISRHAMLIRLVNLGYVRASYYWDEMRAKFLAQEAAYKSGGRSKYYGSRYRTSRGDKYTGLVLEAWSNGSITNHNAAEFMGIKNIAHLDAIRDRFRS